MRRTKELFEELMLKETTNDDFFIKKIYYATLTEENEHEIVRQ